MNSAVATDALPVSETIRAMRRAGGAGDPVPAAVVQKWAADLLSQLYGPQKAVRIETRRRHSGQSWMKADGQDFARASRNGMEFRALYLHPKTLTPPKAHRWTPDLHHCMDCNELFLVHGPDCRTTYVAPDPRLTQAINLTWFKEPLEKLALLSGNLSYLDRQKWERETAYLLERIAQYEKESRP